MKLRQSAVGVRFFVAVMNVVALISIASCSLSTLHSPGNFHSDPWSTYEDIVWVDFSTEFRDGTPIDYRLPEQQGVRLTADYCCGTLLAGTYDSYRIVEGNRSETGNLFSVRASSPYNTIWPTGTPTTAEQYILGEQKRMLEMFSDSVGEVADQYRNLVYETYLSPQSGYTWVRHTIYANRTISIQYSGPIGDEQILWLTCDFEEQYATGIRFGGRSHPDWFDTRVEVCKGVVDSIRVPD